MNNSKEILPIDFKCPNCGIELELEDKERKEKKFTCPECNSLVEVKSGPKSRKESDNLEKGNRQQQITEPSELKILNKEWQLPYMVAVAFGGSILCGIFILFIDKQNIYYNYIATLLFGFGFFVSLFLIYNYNKSLYKNVLSEEDNPWAMRNFFIYHKRIFLMFLISIVYLLIASWIFYNLDVGPAGYVVVFTFGFVAMAGATIALDEVPAVLVYIIPFIVLGGFHKFWKNTEFFYLSIMTRPLFYAHILVSYGIGIYFSKMMDKVLADRGEKIKSKLLSNAR